MSVDLAINELRRVILVTFSGALSESDFSLLDVIGETRQRIALYDCVFDLSAVSDVDLPADFVAERGEIPQAFKDRERVYVVSRDDLVLLVRRYAGHQVAHGWRPPLIVGTLDGALAKLGLNHADFRGA
jgi:hypothetical protein